jgi:hypothetical protein
MGVSAGLSSIGGSGSYGLKDGREPGTSCKRLLAVLVGLGREEGIIAGFLHCYKISPG